MNKIKIISIMIVAMLLGLGAVSVSGSQFLNGDIDVTLTQTLMGLVSPEINLDNESDVTFVVDVFEADNETYYRVNDTLVINLTIDDTTGREEFVFPRSVFFSAAIIRKPKLLPFFGVAGLAKRVFASFVLFGSVNVVNSSLGKTESSVIELPVNYTIAMDPLESEEMTLHLLVMGMPPGDVNGIEDIHVIDYKTVTINVDYLLPR